MGVYAWPGGALGHGRLAIYDTSEQGAQPMSAGGLTLVFNGAIYNFQELRQTLTVAGYRFRSRSDTEVVLNAWRHWGPQCVHRFNGNWAFLLLDEPAGKLYACRDRLGIKPLYYLRLHGGALAFASEPKAFGGLLHGQPKLHVGRLYDFLAHGWQNHAPGADWWEGVTPLAPGSRLACDLDTGQFQQEIYYDLAQTPALSPADLSMPEAAAHLKELLADAVALRLQADVPVALALSGGVDSSAIAGFAPAGTAAFAACFTEPALNELPYVQAVAELRRLKLHTCYPTAHYLWQHLSTLTRYHDAPLGSAAVVAHHQLLGELRQAGYKVVVSGQGADELLAGYDKFYAPYLKGLVLRAPAALGRELAGILLRRQWPAAELLRRLGAYFLQEQNPRPAWLSPTLAAAAAASSMPFARSADVDVRACSINLMREVGLPALLHNEDRNAMAHGLESRLPFLDYRIVAFALSLPDDYKIRYGIRKYLLREAARERLPQQVYTRYRKLGFATPQAQWLKEAYAVLAPEIAALPKQYPEYFAPELPRWAQEAVSRGRPADLATLWRIIAAGRFIVLQAKIYES
jgi:asparagine synthase (glutamine-hydrolysing)